MHTIQNSPTAQQLSPLLKEVEKKKVAHLKTAAFREWQHKQHPNDKLPRGPFFRNKKPGKPLLIMDEFHMYLAETQFPFPYRPASSMVTNKLLRSE